MRYLYFVDRQGISVFANFCYGIAVLDNPQCPPPQGALTKCQYVWLRRTLHCPSCLEVGITVGMIPPSCLLVGINYCSSDLHSSPHTFPTPDKPNSRDYHMLRLDQQWKGMGGVLLLSLVNICSNLHFYVIL